MFNDALISNTNNKIQIMPNGHVPIMGKAVSKIKTPVPELLFITSYPPRECGIATYSYDLIKALNNKFNQSFAIRICAIESDIEQFEYPEEVAYTLNADHPASFATLAKEINDNQAISTVIVQHEFGFFANTAIEFIEFLYKLDKPIVVVFHTVLPGPDELLKSRIEEIVQVADSIVVMTKTSEAILKRDYDINPKKITVIPHGTHLVPHLDKECLKDKYNLTGRKILSTFGLLGSGKSIETTIDALPAIVKNNPSVLFLIIGKTHPSIKKQEGEKYRNMLVDKVEKLKLNNHVQFINSFLPTPDLLEYLQLTDIYLFTSKDPNQAVSGTFSYAISCGCPIISTPIPHAKEVLGKDAGIIVDFGNAVQLAKAVNKLLDNEMLRNIISMNGLHRIASTAWENSAIAHAMLFKKLDKGKMKLKYNLPVINLDHIKKMTTDFGMIQFSVINQPDIGSGYTIDDNARAMISLCQHYKLTNDKEDLNYIVIYLNFIKHCIHPATNFLNYVDEHKAFTAQNNETNLEDSNGRAIWALGYLISFENILPKEIIKEARWIMETSIPNIYKMRSTRAMAFAIKGLYYYNEVTNSINVIHLINDLSDRLVQMYKHECDGEWKWFESYLTYANSTLPEALLCAWLATGEESYLEIAKSSFDFLLSKIFKNNNIKVISNKGWLNKGNELQIENCGGEQPIDVAYSIMALSKFHAEFKEEGYKDKMRLSFNWFLGANHLQQIIYNPCTGGCYDGLEEHNVNLNQGAESTVSYLMARLTLEENLKHKTIEFIHAKVSDNVLVEY